MSVAKEQIPQAQSEAGRVSIDYVNWRGERSLRQILPQRFYLGEVEWHAGVQWLLDAWDLDKGAQRTFAMKDIQAWIAG